MKTAKTSIQSKSHLKVRAGRRRKRGSGVGHGMSRKPQRSRVRP